MRCGRKIGFGLAALLITAMGTIAAAQSWPDKAVRVIVPFPPGGSSDILGRLAAYHLGVAFKQPFVVENKGGAGGLIAADYVAQTEPDGYTLMVSAIASNVIAPAMNPETRFDPMTSFSHIAYLGGPPVVLLVHPSLGVRSYKELIDLARKTPGGLNYVSSGVGTHGHLFAEYLAQHEQIRLNHVPYRGSNLALTDLLAGRVKIGSMAWSSAIEQVRAGSVLPLAVASSHRMPDAPDVPTFKDVGFDIVAATWFALSGPAKMPKAIVNQLNKETNAMLQLPDVQERLAQNGVEVRLMTPEEFTAFVKSEVDRWQPLARELAAKIAQDGAR
jgi:tripartite-type tricarboxylate transporter receptor subunit TctC